MSTQLFPTLNGLGWSVHKRPTFSTRVSSHVSGREVRAPFYQYPLWEFELTFDALHSGSGVGAVEAQSLQTLMGFFLQRQGQFDTFLFQDPTDYAVTDQAIGTGDGSTKSFTALRTLGGWAEPVGYVSSSPAPVLKVAGTITAATLTAPNTFTFASAPANGAAITWTGQFYFSCRFLDDQHDYEQFMQNLWQNQSVKFRSVKP